MSEPNTKADLNSIRKQSRSVCNRVQSILYDTEFVLATQTYFQKPLVANRRCGSWYVPPENAAASCYFKSTDGHTSQWQFSTRRLNLHLLPIIEEHKGIIIVDSTRRGKIMPDAASKTIPIWCAVLNRANGFDTPLWLPPAIVSKSEKEQIEAKLGEFVDLLVKTVDKSMYNMSKPLRPLWFNHGDVFLEEAPAFPQDYHTIIICTASFPAQDGQNSIRGGVSYVQGAADDHELWAGNLTPELFWSHKELHELTTDTSIRAMIESLRPAEFEKPQMTTLTKYLTLANREIAGGPTIDLRENSSSKWAIPAGKKGARLLSNHLNPICDYFQTNGPYVTILDNDNSDAGVAVALMLDSLFFTESGEPVGSRRSSHVPKDEVSRRLAKIAATTQGAPSRTTMNIIGAFLRR